MPRRKRIHLTNVLEYAAYTAAEVVLGMMRAETAFALGELVGRIAYRVPHPYLEIVRRNLRLAYRNELSPTEIEDLVERVYERNGANIASTIRIARLTDEEIAQLTEVVNKDLIQEAASADRGVVFVIPAGIEVDRRRQDVGALVDFYILKTHAIGAVTAAPGIGHFHLGTGVVRPGGSLFGIVRAVGHLYEH